MRRKRGYYPTFQERATRYETLQTPEQWQAWVATAREAIKEQLRRRGEDPTPIKTKEAPAWFKEMAAQERMRATFPHGLPRHCKWLE